jgi:hypothetical protein
MKYADLANQLGRFAGGAGGFEERGEQYADDDDVEKNPNEAKPQTRRDVG